MNVSPIFTLFKLCLLGLHPLITEVPASLAPRSAPISVKRVWESRETEQSKAVVRQLKNEMKLFIKLRRSRGAAADPADNAPRYYERVLSIVMWYVEIFQL